MVIDRSVLESLNLGCDRDLPDLSRYKSMLKDNLHKEGCKNTKNYVCVALGTESTTGWEIKRGSKPYSLPSSRL
jgi:hypothetical protein